MKNNLLWRILGALGSALIVAGVFVPWISTTGYSVSLWSLNEEAIYLPIMIIAFGALGILLFSLNVKTEFVYMSTGAILFQVIVESINMINQNRFNLFGLGYYFLLAGGISIGIITFIINLKPKASKKSVVVENNKNLDINKIDNLYNNEIKPIDIPIEPIKPVNVVEKSEVNIPEPLVQQTNMTMQNNQNLNNYNETNINSNTNGMYNNNQTIPTNNNQFMQQRVMPNFNNQRPDFDVQRVNNISPQINENPNNIPVNPVVQDFVKDLNVEQTQRVVPPTQGGVVLPNANNGINNNLNNDVAQTDIFGQQINNR